MARNEPGIMGLSTERLAPRQVKAEQAAPPVAPPAPAATAPVRKATAQPGRAGKVQIVAYIPKQALYDVQAMLLEISREQEGRVTMQDAIVEALTKYCAEHGRSDIQLT